MTDRQNRAGGAPYKNLRGGLPFMQFVKGGLLFARGVVADLQVGAFACGCRITSLKTGHYKIEQHEYACSPVPAPGVATGLKTLAPCESSICQRSPRNAVN
jgi:hypothetical protein